MMDSGASVWNSLVDALPVCARLESLDIGCMLLDWRVSGRLRKIVQQHLPSLTAIDVRGTAAHRAYWHGGCPHINLVRPHVPHLNGLKAGRCAVYVYSTCSAH
jgi:hypothetical protein